MIKVLLVDDSELALTLLRRLLAPAADIQVVAAVTSGEKALEALTRHSPDVVCTDLNMPGMDGLELTRRILALRAVPILIVSVSVDGQSQGRIFDLLEAGAVDVCPKPVAGQENDELLRKIRIVAGVRVLRRRSSETARPVSGLARPQVIAIGASTGGPAMLQQLLVTRPAGYAIPIVCVQHISRGFLAGLVEWLGGLCRLQIRIARAGDVLEAGSVFFAPDDAHLEVRPGGRLLLSTAPPVGGHRPSITVLLRSVAQAYGARSAGLLLTGMGEDGVDGLQAMKTAGAVTIAQDEGSCAVYGMPRRARETAAAQHVFNPLQMERYLYDVGGV